MMMFVKCVEAHIISHHDTTIAPNPTVPPTQGTTRNISMYDDVSDFSYDSALGRKL